MQITQEIQILIQKYNKTCDKIKELNQLEHEKIRLQLQVSDLLAAQNHEAKFKISQFVSLTSEYIEILEKKWFLLTEEIKLLSDACFYIKYSDQISRFNFRIEYLSEKFDNHDYILQILNIEHYSITEKEILKRVTDDAQLACNLKPITDSNFEKNIIS